MTSNLKKIAPYSSQQLYMTKSVNYSQNNLKNKNPLIHSTRVLNESNK
jgi:hypothetical protein